MSYDASAGSLRCPFCGSGELQPAPDRTVLAPQLVVPFAIPRETAVETLRRWLGQGLWRPRDLARQASVVSMTPVYVPYWVFSAETLTYWTADTDQTPAGARGDWYPLTGEHRGRHEGILVGASGALTADETARLCPFDLAAGVPLDQVDLERVTVEEFSVPRKYARPLARASIERREAEACDVHYVPGRSRNVRVNLRVLGLSSRAVLLPVWIMAYRYRDQAYRFLVNGQSGAAAGQAPISWTKVAVVVGVVVGSLAGLAALLAR
jgi:hypothetical protein